MSRAGTASLARFARHEVRLAWRDWSWLFSGWRNNTTRRALAGIAFFAVSMHLLAYALLYRFFEAGGTLDLAAMATLAICLVLSFAMSLSQATESVTRAFYARDDLDLILSSPAPSCDLFAVRIAMMGLTHWIMSLLMLAPFLNVAILRGGAGWIAGYAVMLAISLFATGVAVLLTLALFRIVGPQRTRLIAQIAAAAIGAVFLIGLQLVAILAYGSMSRFALFDPDFVATHAPGPESLLWIPARALTGEIGPLAALLGSSILFFGAATLTGAVQFRRIVISALGVSERARAHRTRRQSFRLHSIRATLIRKELKLIGRDPWLMSQSLMQVLYLIPPAAMLWISFGDNSEIAVIVAPVIVMAVGQLAGGLAWLTISGEDAPDLISTAPVPLGLRLRAKVEAVLLLTAIIVSPMALALALTSVAGALITFVGALVAASCAILIQLWFRAQAKRTSFRRRQVASKISTFAEAGASILCAGTTALVAAGQPLALAPACLAATVMVIAWSLRPPEVRLGLA